jgi:hypothetical protein
MTALHGTWQRIEQWLRDHSDDGVLRVLFASLLAAAVTVLALDYGEISTRISEQSGITRPPGAPGDPRRRDGEGAARARMAFDLVGDGRLMAAGTIEPETAELFAAEIAKRGSYVKTVVLSSPGGSVADALAMGRLIRKQGYATEVEATCASSCPLVFAGGIERRAGGKAEIGVHQVFAVSATGANLGMDSGQRVSADCQKYLREMGVDLEVWVRAMETPKERLYVFKPDELLAFKLATETGHAKPATTGAQAKS